MTQERWPTVGIVGGGQLARMAQPAAIALGVRLSVLAATDTDSAAQVVNSPVVADEKSLKDLHAFANHCDVVTFDHEHVPPKNLKALEAAGVPLRPCADALVHAQDKAVMRERLATLGIPGPRYSVVSSVGDVVIPPNSSVVLKTARGGYDGKGVWVIDSSTPAEVLAEPFKAGVPVLVEERVDFARELSAVVARSPSGQAVAYPVGESVQRDGVCVEIVAPAPDVDPERAVQAQQIALTIADELDVVGVLAVEMFDAADGRLLVNELAMRPHNSAHWSIDGAVTSQFENHLRAVLDLPLGSPDARAPYTVMVNILGGDNAVRDGLPDAYWSYRHVMAADPAAKVHWYGKTVRPGRKVGHVTVYGDDLDTLRKRAWHVADYIGGVIDE